MITGRGSPFVDKVVADLTGFLPTIPTMESLTVVLPSVGLARLAANNIALIGPEAASHNISYVNFISRP